MKNHLLFVRSGAFTGVMVLLSACGGGSDSSVQPAPLLQTPYTRAEAKTVAGLGLLTAELLAREITTQQTFFAGILQGLSSTSSNSTPTSLPISCNTAVSGVTTPGSGSFTLTVNKAGSYVGFRAGDVLTSNFNNCTFTGSTTAFSGQISLTATATLANVGPNALISYRAATTNFSVADNTAARRTVSNGEHTVSFDTTLGGFVYPESLAVVSAPFTLALYPNLGSGSPSLTFTMGPQANVFFNPTASSRFATRINGDVSTASSSLTVFLRFLTSTALTGSSASGRAVPSAGLLQTTDTGRNLTTQTNISGLNATVLFDSDRNGSLDASFTDSYFLIVN